LQVAIYHLENWLSQDISFYKTKVAKKKIRKYEESYHKTIGNDKNVHLNIEIQKVEVSDHPLILLQNVAS
jgi:hypothetical protein